MLVRHAARLHYNRQTMNNQRILSHFHESAELKIHAGAVLAQPIEQAIELASQWQPKLAKKM